MRKNLQLNSFILAISLCIALLAPKILIADRLGLDFVIFFSLCIGIISAYRYYIGTRLTPTNLYLIGGAALFSLGLIMRDSLTLYALNILALILI